MSIHLATRNLFRSGLAAGALLTALGVANAQTVLPELVVVSPSLVPIEASKTGSSVTAMSGDEIRSSGFSQLSDVMRTFPGMAVSQSGSRGTLTQFRVRGAEANHLLAMLVHDRATRGRFHPATLWGGLFLVASQPLRLMIGGTDTWLAFARWLIS